MVRYIQHKAVKIMYNKNVNTNIKITCFPFVFLSTCKSVVGLEESICLRCQCKYEARNTTLIKVFILG